MTYDHPVITTVSGTMQALQRHVVYGSHWYVTGTVPVSKCRRLVERFHDRYNLGMTRDQREYARRTGRASFRLVLWPLAGTQDLAWWLLRTDGHHDLMDMETWRDARQHRIQWPWMFELVKLPVPKELRAKYQRPDGSHKINAQTWTWRINRDQYERLRAMIRHCAQYRDQRLDTLVRSLADSPGFRGVRNDVWTLYQYIHAQCERRKRPPPVTPPKSWLRFRKSATMPLSALVRRHQRGAASWFPKVVREADTGGVLSSLDALDVPKPAPETDRSPVLFAPDG